jgi:hypothetical protein
MRLVQLLVLLCLLGSCNDNKKYIIEKYANGNTKIKAEIDNDSVLNGAYEEFYETGSLYKRTTLKDGLCLDSVYFYYRNGKLREKGIMRNTVRDGWWLSYDAKGLLTKTEFISSRKNTVNQLIRFNAKGDTIKDSSRFYKLHIPDTLYVGKNIGRLEYFSDSKVKDKFYEVLVNNQISDKVIHNDTFPQEQSITRFGIYAHKEGHKTVEGVILETIMQTNEIGNDSLEFIERQRKILFKKKVYVKPVSKM